MRNTIFLFLFPLTLLAQKHDYNWVMGYEVPGFPDPRWGGLIMDFNTTPVSYKKVNTHLNFEGFGAACSDSSGNLLFYSNGIRIHNKLHQLMENGDTINPGVRTVYEAARWQPEKQLQRRVVHLFPEKETASPPGAHDPGRPAAEPGQPLKKARLTPLQVQYAGENTPTPVKIKGND